MSAPLRFLGLTLVAWVGVRAISLGMFPGMTALVPAAKAAERDLPPIASTDLAQPTPVQPQGAAPDMPYPPQAYAPPGYAPYGYAPQPTYVVVPSQSRAPHIVYASAPAPQPTASWNALQPLAAPLDFAQASPDPWPVSPGGLAQSPARPLPSSMPGEAAPMVPKLDRWQLSTWALLRDQPGASTLATRGTLGGSQAGARLTYRFTPKLAASLRFSSAVGGVRGAEVAAGIRYQPVRSIPIAFNVERREGLGRYGGRSDFAAFAEGGLYQVPVIEKFTLDTYLQAGVVGTRRRDWFADGQFALTRPLWRNLSGGFGVWGGGQPGLYRVDAGPRLTLDVGRGIRLHADYRQRLTGNALPSSGPTLTIAGDF